MTTGYASPYAQSGQQTGSAPEDFGEDYWLNSDPDAAFWKYLRSSGQYDPSSTFGKYAMAQQDRTYNEYKADAAKDPNMGFYDYLKGRQPDLHEQFMNQAPEARNDFSSRMLTPRARWVVG